MDLTLLLHGLKDKALLKSNSRNRLQKILFEIMLVIICSEPFNDLVYFSSAKYPHYFSRNLFPSVIVWTLDN